MFGKKINLVLLSLFLTAAGVFAQTDGTYGGYSPYSVFGVGQLHQSGTSWNRGMGGVGIAARNNRFVNVLNPAAVTARDSLSFMSDFGLAGRMSIFSDGNKKNVNTLLNIDDFVISFPLWRHTAMMLGIRPISDVGYSITSSKIDPDSGKQTFVSAGNGGLYQFFAGAGVTFWNRLSLGAQFNYNFGNISKDAGTSYAESSYRNFQSGDSLRVSSLGVKFGLQYAQKLAGKSALTLGATYQLASKMNGQSVHYTEKGSYDRQRSVIELKDKNLRLGSELGIGLSYSLGDKFFAEFDYTRTDWSSSNLDQVIGFSNSGDAVFAPSVGQSFRLGAEFTPNRSDIRYYLRRCTYRAGAYFEQSYYTVGGNPVNTAGITLGVTLPVFRWYNGISLGIDIGQRGLGGASVKENYFGFNVGFNVFDIWFQKRAYE
ncbi:MAG: hypothetical protein IK008_03065 [Bacteroidales bacterium]|nr:hypothetical protein [Bacteroidales bacterium]